MTRTVVLRRFRISLSRPSWPECATTAAVDSRHGGAADRYRGRVAATDPAGTGHVASTPPSGLPAVDPFLDTERRAPSAETHPNYDRHCSPRSFFVDRWRQTF